MSEYHINELTDALQRLAGSPSVATAVARLGRRVGQINEELNRTVLAEIPAFSESANPDVLPELARHGAMHSQELLRLLGGGAVGEFGFVRDHARRRAEQRFPLEATLHAYRCGHKVFSHRIREATLACLPPARDAQELVAQVADFAIEYTDAISTVAAGAYVEHTRLLADVAEVVG